MSSCWKCVFKRMNKVSVSAVQHIPFTSHRDQLSAQLTADFTLHWYAFLMVQLVLAVHFKHQKPLKIHWLDLFKYISSFEGAAILTVCAHYAYLASVPPRRPPVSERRPHAATSTRKVLLPGSSDVSEQQPHDFCPIFLTFVESHWPLRIKSGQEMEQAWKWAYILYVELSFRIFH